MNIQAVDIVLAASGSPVEIFFRVRCAMPASPLKLESVEQEAPGRWTCHFVPQRPEAEIRYASVLKLQDGLSQDFAILRVESHSDPAAA